MSKYPKQDNVFSQTPLSFLDFWCLISSEVGNHRLEVRAEAKQIGELFPSNSVHPDHLKTIIVGSLPHKHLDLDQPINLTRLLDALGEAAWALRQTASDDLFDIELLEEIAWHISTRFPHLIEMPAVKAREARATELNSAAISSTGLIESSTNASGSIAGPHATVRGDSSQVFSLAKYKTIKNNRLL